VLNLSVPFLTRLSDAGIDDIFILAELAPPRHVSEAIQYLSLTHRSLNWGGRDWKITDGTFDTKRDTLESEPPTNQISFSNLDASWYERLNGNEESMNGSLLTLRLVFASINPSDEAEREMSQIKDGPWVLSGARMNDTAAGFGFGTAFNALKLEIPVLNSRGTRCQWLYKGPFCKSVSSLLRCNQTISNCAERFPEGKPLRFSAWPYSNQRSF